MTNIPAAVISVAGSSTGATSYIICAFVSGFLLATVIFWIVNRKQQKSWQAEYRRLMGGIDSAMNALNWDGDNSRTVHKILQKTWLGE